MCSIKLTANFHADNSSRSYFRPTSEGWQSGWFHNIIFLAGRVGSGPKRDGSDRVRKMDPRRTLGCFIAVPIWQQQASKSQNVEGKCNRFAVLLESVLDASRRRHCLALRRWMVMVALRLEEYRCSVESGTRVRHFAPEMCDRVPAVTLARLQT